MKRFRIDADSTDEMPEEVRDWLCTLVGQMMLEGYKVKFWIDNVEMEATLEQIKPGNA